MFIILMKKILFFIGSRANYSSIKSVMQEVKKKKLLKLQIILALKMLDFLILTNLPTSVIKPVNIFLDIFYNFFVDKG